VAKIPIPQFILDEVANYSDEERASIETAKQRNGVDDFIAGSILDRLAGAGKLYDQNRDDLLETIENSIDQALVLIAFCRNEIDIDAIARRVILLGRMHRVWDPGDNQELESRLKQAFADIDAEFKLHQIGRNDRKMLRKKAESAANLIQKFVNQKDARY
jgi:hypothetical protein